MTYYTGGNQQARANRGIGAVFKQAITGPPRYSRSKANFLPGMSLSYVTCYVAIAPKPTGK
jgi:hypothetical protein